MKAKYTKKQIEESIKHWKRVLESMNENETVHDDQVTENTHLVLEVPGTDGADISIKGDWDAVRFCVDMLTDALNHMRAKDPFHYRGVSLHVVSKDKIDEHTVEGLNRIQKPMRHVINDANGHVTVAELYEMADVLYDGQDDVPLNVGINGEIYGQVNLIKHEGKKCVLTLAPYRNGTRSKNLSVDGWTDEPLRLPEVMHILSSFPKEYEVVVKMKDPYGFGPSAGKSIERPVKAIDVDSAYGIFLRVDDEQ